MLIKMREWMSNQYIKWGLRLFMIFCSLCAIAYIADLRGDTLDAFGNTLEPVLLGIAEGYLLAHWERNRDKRKKRWSAVLGVLFSLSWCVGACLHYKNDLFTGAYDIFLLLLSVLGFCVLSVPASAFLLEKLDTLEENWKGTDKKPVKYRFLKYWMGIFVCWLPVFLANWPGNFIYDAKYQLFEVVNHVYKIHHPLLHTWLMGAWYRLGESWGNVSLGFSFYTLLQMLILSASFAGSLCFLYRHGARRLIRVIVFLFYAVFPVNAIFSITATKDVLFAAFFLGAFLLLTEVCYFGKALDWKTSLGLTALCILMILFRKNAVYALAASMPFLLLIMTGRERRFLLTALAVLSVALANMANNGLIVALHATNDDSLQESLSVPLQQMARAANYRNEEMPEELYEEMTLYLGDQFEEGYNPYLSDGIKNKVDQELVRDNMLNFLKLWAKTGLVFPDEYVESFLTNTMGYWYLGDTSHYMAEGDRVALYHQLIGTEHEIEKIDLLPIVWELYENWFYRVNYYKIPIVGLLARSSLYFWLMLLFIIRAVCKRQYKKAGVSALIFWYFGTCFLGPWVAVRYIYCVIVCWPVLAGVSMDRTRLPESA